MSRLVVRGERVLLDGELRPADVVVVEGRIAAITGYRTVEDTPAVEAGAGVVSPGFVDLQCNGAAGHDLTADPACLDEVAAALLPHGVTSWLPTIVTAPRAVRDHALDELRRRADGPGNGARPLGLHFEGPALNPEHPGAHPPHLLTLPDDAEIESWCHEGLVRMVTAAPEVEGVVPMMRRLGDAGVLVSCGHTAMEHADLEAATQAGARYVTHLFNAMSPFHHRRLGAVGAALDSSALVAGLICDGHHSDPAAVRLARRALGPDRISLVSDASAALDAPLGTMRLGAFEVENTPVGPRLADGTLAGSAIGVDAAVRNYCAMTGAPIEEALGAVTATPAHLLGADDVGRIEVGRRADFTVLDPDLTVTHTIIGGHVAWRR